MRRDGSVLYAYFEVMEMWLSKRVMADRDAEDPATLGTVSIGGKNPAVVTDAEKRQAKVISPGGYCWNPAATDCVLVVIVCMGIQLGATEAAAAGCAAGLVIDILFGKAVGINAIAYMVAGSVGGIFYKKYFADNMIIPVLTVGVCAFLKENLMAILTRMVGGRFSYFGMLITYMVPSALMSAALCIPAHALLKPRLMLSAKKRYDRSAGGIK